MAGPAPDSCHERFQWAFGLTHRYIAAVGGDVAYNKSQIFANCPRPAFPRCGPCQRALPGHPTRWEYAGRLRRPQRWRPVRLHCQSPRHHPDAAAGRGRGLCARPRPPWRTASPGGISWAPMVRVSPGLSSSRWPPAHSRASSKRYSWIAFGAWPAGTSTFSLRNHRIISLPAKPRRHVFRTWAFPSRGEVWASSPA